MRKAQKAQADNFIKLLEQAHDQLQELIEAQDGSNALRLLQDCQEGAVALGTLIEKTEGEGTTTVSILEEYCESVYQIYSQLSNNEEISANKAYRTLKRQLVRITNSIAADITVKKEVVFLPYKASMWDSMESVWRAAENDPDWDVYVVPIPYYDKNPDGSLGERHYEGGQYPEYVQVVHYDFYDLEARRPDRVFVHNPYDECNYVTSVEPRFYSKNLKKFTDQLIYIPYFVLGEDMYESMCVSPGTLLSDRVIAHSEKAKEDYVKHLKAFYVKNAGVKEAEAENMLRKKILPLGSPKIDKVIKAKRKDYSLPEEWEKRLKGKKAVLYNTGVSGILHGNRQELEKIQDTIAFFAKRDDVVLWWRPHPLMGVTVQSMRHQLLNEYWRIVEEYKKSGIGIYDDTADLHRAVIWTDMYYGDDSSVIYLYGVQGKPIVMQNICSLMRDISGGMDRGIRYRIACQAEDSVYFFAWEYNRLYRLELSDGHIFAAADVPKEQQMEPSLYSGMFYDNKTLWLIPSKAHALAAYHLETGKWEQYGLPDRIKSWTRTEEEIYMLSSDYTGLWCMNMHEKKLERKAICYRQKEKFRISDEYYNSDLYWKDGKLYYLITHTNIFAVYDLKSGQAELMHIGSETNRYQRLAYDGSYFWFLPNSDKIGIARWDGKNVRESGVGDYPQGCYVPFGFLNFTIRDNELWLFPYYRGNRILCFDRDTMQMTRILDAKSLFGVEIVDIDHVLPLSDGRLAISASRVGADHCIVLLDGDGQMKGRYPCVCTNEKPIDYSRMFERLEQERYTSAYAYQIIERNAYTLERICDALARAEHTYSEQERYYRSLYANGDGTAGDHIWKEVSAC